MRSTLRQSASVVLSLLYLGTIELASMHDHAPANAGVGVPTVFVPADGSADGHQRAKAPTSHCALCVASFTPQLSTDHFRFHPSDDRRVAAFEQPADAPTPADRPAHQRRGPPSFHA